MSDFKQFFFGLNKLNIHSCRMAFEFSSITQLFNIKFLKVKRFEKQFKKEKDLVRL